MYTAQNDLSNDLSFVFWLLVSLAISWLLIYTAVRTGVGHALDRVEPRLVAETNITLLGVEFVVSNIGLGPAFDVSVRWLDAAADKAHELSGSHAFPVADARPQRHALMDGRR